MIFHIHIVHYIAIFDFMNSKFQTKPDAIINLSTYAYMPSQGVAVVVSKGLKSLCRRER